MKREKESTTESMLRTQFKMELCVNSLDRSYNSSLSERKLERAEDENKEKGISFNTERSIAYSKDNHATLQELMSRLKSYFKVS